MKELISETKYLTHFPKITSTVIYSITNPAKISKKTCNFHYHWNPWPPIPCWAGRVFLRYKWIIKQWFNLFPLFESFLMFHCKNNISLEDVLKVILLNWALTLLTVCGQDFFRSYYNFDYLSNIKIIWIYFCRKLTQLYFKIFPIGHMHVSKWSSIISILTWFYK